MKISISCKHLRCSSELTATLHEKSERLGPYLKSDSSVKWSCSQKGGAQHAELTIWIGRIKYQAMGHGTGLQMAVDRAVERVLRQLRKSKEIVKNGPHRKRANLVILDPESAWGDYDEDQFDDLAGVKLAA
jgi:putative sigma-54 modulation protein